jgi:hypothetical protein
MSVRKQQLNTEHDIMTTTHTSSLYLENITTVDRSTKSNHYKLNDIYSYIIRFYFDPFHYNTKQITIMSPNKSRSSSIVAVSMVVLAIAAQTTEAFVPSTTGLVTGTKSSVSLLPPLYAEETTEETNSVFMPPADADAGEGDIDLSTVEMLGKGAAKVCIIYSVN